MTKLEKLEVVIWTDFKNAKIPQGMNNSREFSVYTLTKWKAEQKDEQIIEISQSEIIKENYLKLRIPEYK